ncbi:hypothetical protein AK812_SmicGene26030 [Symbiodinium microadriaticum]|uniref:Uncharacterized protein n=1 Tax=Symbiodinium microadriaticum TaxID=2951 RepID=A0A1Q9DAF8_SYMMI|nr:hypothetical protein AK812_SmicGene26030 [Symbiodinium microadriaticum]
MNFEHGDGDEDYLPNGNESFVTNHRHLQELQRLSAFQQVTSKVPPSYDGRSGWVAYEDAIDDWCDITELDGDKRGPALRNRLEGEAAIHKRLVDRAPEGFPAEEQATITNEEAMERANERLRDQHVLTSSTAHWKRVLADYRLNELRGVYLEIFCTTKTSVDHPLLAPSGHGGRKTFLVIDEGHRDNQEGYWVEDEEDGTEGFLEADEDSFWVYDEDSYSWLRRRFQGRKMKRGFKGQRKGKGRGRKGSGGRRFFKKRKGRSNLADNNTEAWQAKGQWHDDPWQESSWDDWSWDYAEESYAAKGKGKKGKKGKGKGKYGKDGKAGKGGSKDLMKFCDQNKDCGIWFQFDLQPDKEPENLGFATDDEWMIDENKMELIHAHKKMRQIKYEPKVGSPEDVASEGKPQDSSKVQRASPQHKRMLEKLNDEEIKFGTKANLALVIIDGYSLLEIATGRGPPDVFDMVWLPEARDPMHVGEEALHLERNTWTSWQLHLALRTCGGDGTVLYRDTVNRKWPRSIWPAMIKLKPESVPLFPGHKEVTAYFPFGEMAVTDLVEGQLAVQSHIKVYEEAHMEQMCRMEPIYNRRSTRMDVIFRAGDFRSTLDDREMAKASRAQEEGSIGDEPYELMNAMLHYFLAAGVDDEAGKLNDREHDFLHRRGMDSVRVCVFHLNSKVASGQVDLIVGDPNMALDRYSSTRQESMDIQGRLEYISLSGPDGRYHFWSSRRAFRSGSTSANYLLNDTDYDAHTPLLVSVHATHYSSGRARAMNRNPDTLQEKAEGGSSDNRRTKLVVLMELHQLNQALPLERQVLVLALVLQLVVHNVLPNPHILLVGMQHLAKAAKEASPPRAKEVEASPLLP